MAEIRAEHTDANHRANDLQYTRQILAEENPKKPAGVKEVTVVPAYNSTESAIRDFPFDSVQEHLEAQGYLLSRRLAVTDLDDPEDSLRAAIELSSDTDFQQKRSDLFDWQELAVQRGWKPEDTVARVAEMVDRYNEKVRRASGTVKMKFAFTLFSAGLSAGLGLAAGSPIGATVLAALSLISFAAFDRKPPVEVGKFGPVLMFHDVEARLGIKLL